MDMGYMGGYGSTFGFFIGSLVIFFVKLLMVVLVITLIAGIILWTKNNFFKDLNLREGLKERGRKISQSQLVQTINNDPILKIVSVILLVIVGVVLLFSLFNGNNEPGIAYGITALLMMLAKLLMWVLIISLFFAALVYIKNQYEKFGKNKNQESQTPTTIDIQPTNNQ